MPPSASFSGKSKKLTPVLRWRKTQTLSFSKMGSCFHSHVSFKETLQGLFPREACFSCPPSLELCKPTTDLCKSGQSREARVKSSPDLSNLCSILIKISLPFPHHPLPPPHHSDTSLYVIMSLHLVWGTVVLPENPPLRAHVANTFIPLLGQAGHRATVSWPPPPPSPPPLP